MVARVTVDPVARAAREVVFGLFARLKSDLRSPVTPTQPFPDAQVSRLPS